MGRNGIEGDPVTGLHHSRFQSIEADYGILLTGVPDEIVRFEAGLVIIDYKTARHSDGHDALLPVYRVQLNCYARIAERLGMGQVRRLALLYYEPKTDISVDDLRSLTDAEGFALRFEPHLVEIALEPEIVPPLLAEARRLYDLPIPPACREGCKNCGLVRTMTELAAQGG